MIKKKALKKRILSIGCGNDTYGTDFVDLYPARPEVKKLDIDKNRLPYPNDTFDKVICKASLHHFKDTNHSLREMTRVLKKGQKVIITTDNASCLVFHLLQKTNYGEYEKQNRLVRPHDKQYSLFTMWNLKNHFDSLHLKVVGTKYIAYENSWHNIIYKILSFLVGERLSMPQILIVGRKWNK